MGKIRIKTFGLPEDEEQEKKKAKEKREAKKLTKAPGLKGADEGARLLDKRGREKVVLVEPSEEELANISASEAFNDSAVARETSDKKTATTKTGKLPKKEKFAKERTRSQRYQASALVLDRSKIYPLSDALELLAKFQKTKFDGTVELHVNTNQTSISASVILPHGTGKKVRVAVADDKLISEIEGGRIDFDILLAKPDMMLKLARVAKILGPKGLMPNPKNGTITDKPQDLIKKYEGGQINIKTEAKAPLIHLTVGKISFGEKKLADNIESIIGAIKKENIQKIVLKSTMSPGINIRL